MSVINRSAIDFNYACAAIDVQCQVHEVGFEMIFEPIVETGIVRDKYRSIRRNIDVPTAQQITMYAYPCEFSPNTKQIEKAGLFEQVDVIAYTPMKTWEDNNYTFQSIDIIRWDVTLQNVVYHIEEKKRYGQLGSQYLYVVFGLVKK